MLKDSNASNASLAVLNVHTLRLAVNLISKPASRLIRLLTSYLPRLLGTLSGVSTANFVSPSAVRSGATQLKVIGTCLRNSGNRSISYSAVGSCRRAQPSVWTNSVDFLSDKVNTVRSNTAEAPDARFSQIGSADIIPTTAVRDLEIYIDAALSMRSHVQRTVAGCFAILRQLRSIRRSVPSCVFRTLVVVLVLTRLDYDNATLLGLPAYLLNRQQSVLNASARLIAGLRRLAHNTDAVASFH